MKSACQCISPIFYFVCYKITQCLCLLSSPSLFSFCILLGNNNTYVCLLLNLPQDFRSNSPSSMAQLSPSLGILGQRVSFINQLLLLQVPLIGNQPVHISRLCYLDITSTWNNFLTQSGSVYHAKSKKWHISPKFPLLLVNGVWYADNPCYGQCFRQLKFKWLSPRL